MINPKVKQFTLTYHQTIQVAIITFHRIIGKKHIIISPRTINSHRAYHPHEGGTHITNHCILIFTRRDILNTNCNDKDVTLFLNKNSTIMSQQLSCYVRRLPSVSTMVSVYSTLTPSTATFMPSQPVYSPTSSSVSSTRFKMPSFWSSLLPTQQRNLNPW